MLLWFKTLVNRLNHFAYKNWIECVYQNNVSSVSATHTFLYSWHTCKLLYCLTDASGWTQCTWNLVTFNLPSTSSQSLCERPQLLFGRFSNKTVVMKLNLLDNLVLSYCSVLLVEIAPFVELFHSSLRPIYMIITASSPRLDRHFLCRTSVLLIYYAGVFCIDLIFYFKCTTEDCFLRL